MRLVNIRPGRATSLVLGILPVAALVFVYVLASASRHAINPGDRILPTPAAMVSAMHTLMFVPDPMTGRLTLWADTLASLQRLCLGLAISTLSALIVGLALGLVPLVRALFGPLVTIIALIPPIALLPILFIMFGLGETAKVMLIIIGILPVMIRDVAAHVETLPTEQMLKAQTLGASSWQLAIRVALPQMMPRLIHALRLALGPAWVFLISAEAIAADIGLGYRIFLVRRYLAMDIILPYVAWIALLAIALDWLLRLANRRLFPWAGSS
ncbi:ABC transporter permease [Stakelama sp. CBK3Z-3]|uniref:ABC transporter permease n=1 Tax=Stakelama flava TaxID=2860338 RepID=A0ABS6XPL3_9SPHN|nr:ABC transporter permease [Stakelama flava]MBW4331819.1 ABC transporter permease [Stakelama flava]